jgi:hypothetical protein
MTGLKKRIDKLEKVLGASEELRFREYFGELLGLIGRRPRCLPSEEKEDPVFDAACDSLKMKYANQPSEAGRKRFEDDYKAAMYSVCDCEECAQYLETGVG